MSTELVKVEPIASDVIYQQDKAQIDMQIATAKQYPRNIIRATENAVTVATLSTETAQSCNYSLPRGGRTISGPSVHLARILAQQWGNMRIEAKVTAIEQTQIVSEAVAFDLENNLAVKVEVRKPIVGRNGRYKEDMIAVTGNSANATALRNAIFAVIPKSVTDSVYNSAKRLITGDLSDKEKLTAKRIKILNGLKDLYNVSETDVLRTLGKASVNNINADDILNLIGMIQAIKDGDTTVKLTFQAYKEEVKSPKKANKQKAEDRVLNHIKNAKDLTALAKVKSALKTADQKRLYTEKAQKLT